MSIQVTPIPRLTVLTVPAFTLGTANAAGSADTAIASDSTLLVFDTTLPDAITYGQSGAAGTSATAARRSHAHAMAAVGNAVKGYARLNGAGALHPDSYNVDTVTATGTGDATIVWDVDFSTTNYTLTGILSEDADGDWGTSASGFALGSVVVRQKDVTTLTNIANTHAAFGTQ